MKARRDLVFPFVCVWLFALIPPADAFVTVLGSPLAHDCFILAKAGTNPRGALATCNAALDGDQLTARDRAGTLVNRAVVKMALKRTQDAMDDYNAGIALYPALGDAYVNRAAAFILLERFDEAQKDIDQGFALGLSAPYVGYYNRAILEELTGRYKESYYDFKKTLELQPDFTLAAERLKDFTVTTKPAARGN